MLSTCSSIKDVNIETFDNLCRNDRLAKKEESILKTTVFHAFQLSTLFFMMIIRIFLLQFTSIVFFFKR